MKKLTSIVLTFALILALTPFAFAKTNPAGQTVGNVLFYVENAEGEQILVSQLPVSEMEADMQAGLIDDTNHNYSLLDKFTTTLHQEAQGFTVPEFIEYAQEKSPLDSLKSLPLELSGASTVQFWEIDQTGYDDMDAYTYADLYEVPRFNFPLLYEYWDYAKQDYYDPNGKMSKAEVIDHIYANREPETVLLSVRAFSQRYMVTSEKFGIDYNLENYWHDSNLMDNARTIRIMKPMTRDELYNKTPTASDTRYWTANILLTMADAPEIAPLGEVAAPTATMTEYDDNYYVYLNSSTAGATILYNHNFMSPSYTPTSPYQGEKIVIPKEYFPSGTVTLTARAIKEGYTDVGVVTLKLTSSGTEQNPESAASFSDVEPGIWYETAVNFVTDKKLFDVDGSKFKPSDLTTRAELAIALYRLEGSPSVTKFADFPDVTKGTPLSAAVSWASEAKIIAGNGDGTFTPNANITREMIAVMFYNYAKYKGTDTKANGDLTVFTDSGDIASWSRTGLSWAVAHKIFSGNGNGKITPKATSTRAMVAQILYNYVRK